MKSSAHSRAFTLIELLIVIAIILILIAIALPNFLEAQIRAKVVNAEAEMRSLNTALESYQTDWKEYPPDEVAVSNPPYPTIPLELRAVKALSALTTPIQYMTEISTNPFPNSTDGQPDSEAYFRYFAQRWKELLEYNNPNWPKSSKQWSLASAGPDLHSNVGEYLMFGPQILETIPAGPTWESGAVYSPTNGTKSEGDLVRIGP